MHFWSQSGLRFHSLQACVSLGSLGNRLWGSTRKKKGPDGRWCSPFRWERQKRSCWEAGGAQRRGRHLSGPTEPSPKRVWPGNGHGRGWDHRMPCSEAGDRKLQGNRDPEWLNQSPHPVQEPLLWKLGSQVLPEAGPPPLGS